MGLAAEEEKEEIAQGEKRAEKNDDDPRPKKVQKTRESAPDEAWEDKASSESESSQASVVAQADRRTPAADVSFSLERLQDEIASLRQHTPPYITDIGLLQRPTLVCDEEGQLKPPDASEASGPWDLLVCVAGPEGDPAYGRPWRVNIRFDHDLWPSKLALVRFRGVFHHALTDEEGVMLMPFYRALPRDERGACTVRLLLQHVRNFLVDPLKSWKVASTPEKFQLAINAHRKLNTERLDIIRKYESMVRHPELFQRPPAFKEEWFEPGFLKALQENTASGWRSILNEHLPGEVFSFKLFTESFCDFFLEEVFSFYSSGLPARRPNSMNAYGIILNDIGLEPLIDELQRLLQPLGELLFPGAGQAWDGHHCFIVRYRAGEDLGLDMHTDDSDVTFNLCLGLEFSGAGLQFCGMTGAPNARKHSFTYKHVKGSCICHLGRQRHGADDISSGERLNLILWNKSSTYRQSDESEKPQQFQEAGPPDPVCVSYTHDRDFGNFKDYPKGKEHFRGRGWCPRPLYEYPGFKPDCDKEEEPDS
eukprot:TRINITY_DN21120_c0_g1_i1.p1 TRINITY_DN21120_c0_g1~~TRINITY_DN21120_c0_g1_i1.p1  ORF type:complete len:536 (-),score=110.86 TRINITY_DN21120_c0_g1_i1:143-1750(-)